MKNQEKTISLVRQSLKELQLEIERHANSAAIVGDISQLRSFKVYLEGIREQMESNCVPDKDQRRFGMGKAITDSWPLDSKLGNLLCSAEEAYSNL